MMNEEISPSAHTTEFTILMALLMSVVAISIDALLPALGVIGEDLRVSNPNHAQYLIGAIFGGMAIGQLIAGPLSDAMGRKPVLYAGISLYLVGSLICFTAHSLEVILIGRFVQGLGVSGPYVSTMSVVRDKFSGRHMARVMSIVMMIFMMVPALAPSFGQGIMLLASWRAIFLMYILYSVTVGLWIFLRLEETLPKENRIAFDVKHLIHGFREVTGDRATVCYMICMGTCFGGLIGYLNSSQQIFQDQFGAGHMFTVYFGLLAVVLGISSMVNSRLVERLGMRFISMRAFTGIVAASVAFLALHMFVDIQLWMFMVYAAALFFAFGLLFGNLNSLAMEPMGHIAGMASAIIGATSSVISLVLGAIIGQLYNGTLIPMTMGFLVLGGFSLLIMSVAHKQGEAFSNS